jgi:hypothetical protein
MTSLLLFLSLISYTPLYAISDSTPPKGKIYVANINKSKGKASLVYLQGLNDTALQLNKKALPFGSSFFDYSVSYQDLDYLSVYRKGQSSKAVLGGMIGGILIGGVIGGSVYKPKPCNYVCIDFGKEASALAGASAGAVAGALFGLAIGSVKWNFKVNRNKEKFQQMRTELLFLHINEKKKE